MRVLSEVPEFPDRLGARRIFSTVTEDISDHPEFRDSVFSSKGFLGWKEIGAAVLLAAGWGPDCARAVATFVERLSPPKDAGLQTIDGGIDWGK